MGVPPRRRIALSKLVARPNRAQVRRETSWTRQVALRLDMPSVTVHHVGRVWFKTEEFKVRRPPI